MRTLDVNLLRNKTSNGSTVPRDDDLFSPLYAIEQTAEFVLSFKRPDFANHTFRIS